MNGLTPSVPTWGTLWWRRTHLVGVLTFYQGEKYQYFFLVCAFSLPRLIIRSSSPLKMVGQRTSAAGMVWEEGHSLRGAVPVRFGGPDKCVANGLKTEIQGSIQTS